MDLRLEQPILHLKKATVSHIRRGHNVGSAMIITLNNMQAEIRTHVPFYNLDPTLYNYGDQNARWRYTWDINYRYNINMTLKKTGAQRALIKMTKTLWNKLLRTQLFMGKITGS